MRKVSFGLAVGFVLVACGGGETEPPKTPATPAPTMTTAPTTTASAEPPKEEPKKLSFAEMQGKTMTGFVEALVCDHPRCAEQECLGQRIQLPLLVVAEEGPPVVGGDQRMGVDWRVDHSRGLLPGAGHPVAGEPAVDRDGRRFGRAAVISLGRSDDLCMNLIAYDVGSDVCAADEPLQMDRSAISIELAKILDADEATICADSRERLQYRWPRCSE